MSNPTANPSVAAAVGSGPTSAKSPKAPKPKEFNKKDQVQLFRGLASMLRAQITTADALKYYGHGLTNKSITEALERVRTDINNGISVHEGFRRTQRFNDMTIGLIQAGNDSGQLFQAFKSLADRLAGEIKFQKALKKAVTMPIIVITILTGAFIGSQVKIVPQIEDMLRSVQQKPDGFTAIIFNMSHITQKIWPLVLLCIAIAIAIIWRSAKIREIIIGIGMARIRTLRRLIMSMRQMTFLATMELLHSNGINLAKSIRVSANSVANTPFQPELKAAADKYEHSGVPLSTAFAKYTSVDPQVSHMLAIGEKSASLDSQLHMLVEMYDEESNQAMETFTALVNFAVLIIAVILLTVVFVGTFMPIFMMGPKMMQRM